MLALGLTEIYANAYMPPEAKQQMAPLIALGRAGKLEGEAIAVAFLASDDSNFVTGSYMLVDGGFILVR